MKNIEKSEKRISSKWKLCIFVIFAAVLLLYLMVRLIGYIRKNDTWGWEGDGDALKLCVQKEGESLIYTSTDGAITWSDGKNPDFYMQISEEKLTDGRAGVPIVIVNVSDDELMAGEDFLLYMWDGNEWIPSEVNYLPHNDIGYIIHPHVSWEMTCGLYSIQLEAGKYFISKTVFREKDRTKWTLSTEFIVE